jgi:hypothetical protein
MIAIMMIAGIGYSLSITEDWNQPVTTYSATGNGNEARDVAYNAATGHILITDTDMDRIHILNSADGTDTGNDLTTTCTTPASYVAWLGPYGISCSSDGVIYLSAYVTNFGVGVFSSESALTCDAASTTTNNSRGLKALDGVAAASQILYVAGNASGHPIDIMDTSDGLTFTAIESPAVFGDARYGAGPAATNTGGDGDTIIVCGSTTGAPRKFDRAGGTWTQDTNFAPTQIGNKCELVTDGVLGDIVFVAVFSGGADEDGIWCFDADDGTVLQSFDWDTAYGAQTNSGNNAGIDVDPANKKIYFTADEFSRYGRCSYDPSSVEDWSLY